jgi:tetratricopeptide (TPR) repeat protein
VTSRSEQAPFMQLETPARDESWLRADAQRRAGRPAEAERLARRGLAQDPESLQLRVVLALALLDQRRTEEAREELEKGLGAAEELPAELSEQELADAFEHAEPETEHLLDADHVAQQALREAELGPADELSPPHAADSLFATRTMAELLERQGDRAGAERILDRLERARGDSQGASASDRRGRVVRELERWLANLRTEA